MQFICTLLIQGVYERRVGLLYIMVAVLLVGWAGQPAGPTATNNTATTTLQR
jgi:hypothetical protein